MPKPGILASGKVMGKLAGFTGFKSSCGTLKFNSENSVNFTDNSLLP
jgi:hypothetical protein